MIRQENHNAPRYGVLICLMPALSIFACADGAADESRMGVASDTLAFTSADDALAWLATKSPDYPGSHILKNEAGIVRSITFDDLASRDALLNEFKRFRTIRVAGTDFPTETTTFTAESGAAMDTEIRTSALTSGVPSSREVCSGAFCITGVSINDHYSIFGVGYHHVGGSTGIASGGTKSFYCPTPVFGNLTCFAPYQKVLDPDYVSACDTGGNPGYACVYNNGTEHVGVAVTYFTNVTNCGSGACVSTPTAIRTDQAIATNENVVGTSLTALGYFVLPCANGNGPAECDINGVCSSHSANANTFSAQTTTAAGSYDCNP